MRVAEVIGTITLSRQQDEVAGGRFILVRPLGLADLAAAHGPPAEPVVAYDELSPGLGARVAISEGREAAMPFYPRAVPIDVYCAAVLDHVHVDRAARDSNEGSR